MKSLFSAYGTSGTIILPLYTNGTENVSWVKGIDTVTGSGTVGGGTLTEGVSYATLSINNEPTGFMTTNISYATNAQVDITGYKRVGIDWEVITAGTFGLIISSERDFDINEFEAKVTFNDETGRKTSYLPINSFSGSTYVRVNAYAVTSAPSTKLTEIRIHRVWLEK
jgi:hypothetical protein